MPELPDVVLYIEALESRILGRVLERVAIPSPFVLRSVDPPIAQAEGRRVVGLRRMGKRIVIASRAICSSSFHLMIAGRLRWREAGSAPANAGRIVLATFEFDSGTLLFTEAGTKKRASLHLVAGESGLRAHDRGGLEVLDADRRAFAAVLVRGNHTLKRALTDPTLFSGIGNAYSDEILHRAKLSPMKLTQSLAVGEIERLFDAVRSTLLEWTQRLRAEAGGNFPEKVTAFRPGMAVHGKHGEPCPDCGGEVQRIAYAESECNYCPRCQTGGRLLADRALSRLMHEDWPRTADELEALRERSRADDEGSPPG
jgi:formamidopyrimidine-DNA glycosylase